ncbi:MAG TPA: type IV pilus assembly protein PilM [Symbiobacteriaceae bacterium]|jgi:type IV pilus assembly protein PilM
MSLLERVRPTPHDPLPAGSGVGFRWGAFGMQRRTSVGIDFGSGTLKVVQIRWTRSGPRLENYAVVPVPPGMMHEGSVKDPRTVGELVRSALAEMNCTQTLIGTCVGGPSVLMRYINLPKVSPEELRSAMKFEAPQHLPIAEEDLVYDFTPVAEVAGVPEHQVAVFLAGTQQKLVDSLLSALGHAQVRPTAVELDCLATHRSLQWLGLVSYTSPLPLVLVDFGESGTRLHIMRHEVPMLSRTIPTGVSQLRVALADTLHVSPAEAEKVLRTQGVKGDLDLTEAVEPWMNDLLESVSRSLEFFLIQNRGVSLERIFLVGGGAALPNLPELLHGHLRKVLTGRPEVEQLRVQAVGLAGLDINPELLPGVNAYGPLLMNALGCALREGSPE